MRTLIEKVVFVDLDSTICNTEHRHGMAKKDPEEFDDWLAYALRCPDDEPFVATIRLLQFLHAGGTTVVILSGRNSEARDLTEDWLQKHEVPYDDIILRDYSNPNHADGSTNGQFKAKRIVEWLDSAPIRYGKDSVLMIDDWPEVKMKVEEMIDVPVFIFNPLYPGEDPAMALYASQTENPTAGGLR